MANYMFVLRPTEKKYKVVCPLCAKVGMVEGSCMRCHGAGVVNQKLVQYYVQDKPIEIVAIDRDKKTGVLRYWENLSEFFYETLTPALNNYVPEVPYGVHLCHDTRQQANTECNRVNMHLHNQARNVYKANVFNF